MTLLILRPVAPRRNRFRSLLLRVAVGVAGLLVAAGSSIADIQQSRPAGREEKQKDKDKGSPRDNIRRAAEIPTPQDAAVTVLRGVPTDIVLSATAALRQPVLFRLGDAPAHGSLGPLRPSAEAPTKAVVTYTAAPGLAAADAFTFRVRHRDTATSGSATVRVRIVDPAAELVAPTEIDFGEAVVGETAVRPLVLENRGTAAFAARLRLDAPWRLMQETPEVEVAAGARVELRVAYTPTRPGDSVARLDFPGAGVEATRLAGRAIAPVRLQPSLVQLAWDPAGRARQAVVTITNRLNEPVGYSLASSPRVQYAAERGTLPAKASAEVTVSLPATDVAEIQSLLSVVAHGVSEEVALTAPAAPALLALREAAAWEQRAGQLDLPARAEEGTLVFANEGGTAASLLVTLPAGWTSPGYEDGADLGPGETRRLLLVPPADRPSGASGSIQVALDEERLVLGLHAPPPPPPRPSAGPDALLASSSVASSGGGGARTRPLTGQEEQTQFMVDTIGIFPANLNFDRGLPELPAVSVTRLEPGRISLSFKSVGGGTRYVVFREEYRPPPGGVRPTRHWLPVEGLKWTTTGQTASTTLEGLVPGARVLLRFAVQAADGRVGPPSNAIAVTTPTRRPRPWGWLVSGAVLAGGVGWWWHRRRALQLKHT